MGGLGRYVSWLVQHIVTREATEFDAASSSRRFACSAAVLLVDLSGYTALTRRASREGAEALERFNDAVNLFFCDLLDPIQRAGGDVVAFAGDAVVAVFPVQHDNLVQAIQRAVECAEVLQGVRLSTTGTDSAACRVTLASGSLWIAIAGTGGERRYAVVGGEALERLAHCQHPSSSEATLVIDSETTRLMRETADLFPANSGLAGPLVAVSEAIGQVSGQQLRSFLSPMLAERLERGHDRWIAELRTVHAIFVRAIDPGALTPDAAVEQVEHARRALAAFDGELHQVRVDEQGLIVIGLFGTPGHTHADDASRALRCASDWCAKLRIAGRSPDIGVCGGLVLCGVYGNKWRQDYVLLGDAMNLAARLMQQRQGLLVEADTIASARGAVDFEPSHAIELKGFDAPIRVASVRHAVQPNRAPPVFHPMVGRQKERTRVSDFLATSPESCAAVDRTLLVEGEAGIGKTMLAAYVVEQARRDGWAVLTSAGLQIERNTSYFAWRKLVRQALGDSTTASSMTPVASLEALVCERLESNAELLKFAPLLSDVLGIDLAPNDLTQQMESAARASMTSRLLLHLVADATMPRCLLVAEDAHWLDSASWSVLIQCVQERPAVHLFVTTRPDASEWSAQTTEYANGCRQNGLRLDGLSDSEIGEIAARRLGQEMLTAPTVRFIRDRSGGNPFFAEELALSLQEAGQLNVASGTDMYPSLPTTVQATVLERIDRLSGPQQLILKIASVLGAIAPMRALLAIAGAEVNPLHMEGYLRSIEERQLADFLDPSKLASNDVRAGMSHAIDAAGVLHFRHAITQETVYAMLPPSQRRALHHQATLWYERAYANQIEVCLPLLAHHSRSAQDWPRAIDYLARAGEQAVQTHANAEAVRFLDDALSIESALEIPQITRVRHRRLLAEAHLKLSHLAPCRELLAQTLELAGSPLPAHKLGLVGSIVGLIPKEIAPKGSLNAPPSSAARDRNAALIAQLHQLRAEVAYFEHDTLSLLHGTFAGLRAARSAGPSRELALTHGTAAIVLGLMRLRRLSRRHLDAATSAADAAGHLPTAAYVQHLACVCASSEGDWQEAERTVELAAEGYKRTGDEYRWQSTRMILAYQALHRGNLAAIDRYLEQSDEHTLFPTGPLQLRTWYRTVQLARWLADGEHFRQRAPRAWVDEVRQLGEIADPSQALLCHGFCALAAWRDGDATAAMHDATTGLEVLQRHQPSTYFSLFGIISIGDVFLHAGERNEAAWRQWRPSADQVIARLRRFAFIVPISRPALHLLNGRRAVLEGHSGSARRRLKRALEEARAFGMAGLERDAQACLASLEEATSELPFLKDST